MESPRRVSQQELAAACDMTQATVSRLLAGQEPKSGDLFRIADFFSVPMEWLITGELPRQENVKVAEEAESYLAVQKLTRKEMEEIHEALEDLHKKFDDLRAKLKK